MTWAYDTGSLRKGRLYTVTNATAASTFTYNKMGQVTREDKTIEGIPFSLIRTYNLAGAQTSMTLPNGTKISNAYNSAGQLTQITSDWVDANHPAVLATGFEYAPSGALTYLEYGNGTASSRSFNSSGQLKTLQHGPLGDPGGFLDYQYQYNEGTANNGQIVSIDDFNDTTKSFTYTYDTLGRLKTAATTGTHWGLSWTYDRYGNRLSQSVTKGTAPSQSLSVSTNTNRVTTWTYDAAGNTLNDGQHSYSYDANNMITQLDAGAAVYKYDGQGNRVVKQTATETIYYFFGVAEYSAGTWRKLYFFGGGAKLAEYSNGTTYFFHTDHLGTPRIQTATSGSVVETWSNFPYGEQWSTSGGVGNEHRYTGHLRDPESHLDMAGARYLTASNGRWSTVDPIIGDVLNPQRLNRFAFVMDDPLNQADPTGTNPMPIFDPNFNSAAIQAPGIDTGPSHFIFDPLFWIKSWYYWGWHERQVMGYQITLAEFAFFDLYGRPEAVLADWPATFHEYFGLYSTHFGWWRNRWLFNMHVTLQPFKSIEEWWIPKNDLWALYVVRIQTPGEPEVCILQAYFKAHNRDLKVGLEKFQVELYISLMFEPQSTIFGLSLAALAFAVEEAIDEFIVQNNTVCTE